MKTTKKVLMAICLTAIAIMAASCSTPTNIVYFQDLGDSSVLEPANAEPIRFQPMDKLSIIVTSRDPQVSAMFNLPVYTGRIGENQSLTADSGIGSRMTTGGSGSISGYTVNSEGNIDFPIIGSIHIAGLTREEAEGYIKRILVDSKQIKDPVVTIEYMNLGFSVLGEVNRPGRFRIDRDRYTLLDALGMAGDLTINGLRENVTLVRHDAATDKDTVYKLNLLESEQLYASPAFYIQQSDIIYVTPNDKRLRESIASGNAAYTPSFWFSIASLLTSISVLVFK